MEVFNGIHARHFKTRSSWRLWLEKNHAKSKALWLILYNANSSKASIRMEEAVEEALCFGWIDSKAVKRDDESRYQYFSPRKPKSNWSKVNRERVGKLEKAGLIAPAGQALIDLAKSSGTWDALKDVESLVFPDDLRKEFKKNKAAFENFNSFSPSSQRVILYWILSAKRPETRQKRIRETVEKAGKKMKPYP
jgi:uncharacterized protein YdeI (YjbR/CyaY-like superfamily)